jgi:pyridoxamine 5'-phosphate oxidase
MQLAPFEQDEPGTWHAVVWRLMERACQDNTSSLRYPVVSTVSEEGPQGRVVLLRAADPHQYQLTLFTDARSPKVAQLRTDARMAWTFWDDRLRLQIRAQSKTAVHQHNERAAAVRTQIPPSAWRDYTTRTAPGDACTLIEHDPSLFEQNFCVIDARVFMLDILALRSSSAGGHKRLQLDYSTGQQQWLVP